MKYYLGFLLILIVSYSQAQPIRVVNNNPGAAAGTNVYFTLQAGIDAANPGDIIHIVPSSVIHSDSKITKSLTLIGVGFRADKDIGAKSQVAQLDINASDVRISGLVSTTTWYIAFNIGTVTISNLIIENNRFGRLRVHEANSGVTVANILIRNNIITAAGGTFDSKNIQLQVSSNVVVTNNVIVTTCCSNSGTKLTGATITNNIFYYTGTPGNSGNTFTSLTNCIVEYNIFYGSTQNVPGGSSGNVFNYNMAFGNADNTFTSIGVDGNTGTGNISDIDPLFDNLPRINSWNDSYKVTIDPSSQAINIDGSGGIAGVTGGATPWDPEGTLIPTIQSVEMPSVVSQGSDLQIKIKVKGN